MIHWLSGIDRTWKAIIALCGALALGVTVGGWLGVPAQVKTNMEDLVVLKAFKSVTESKLDRILCHLEEQRKVAPEWTRCER